MADLVVSLVVGKFPHIPPNGLLFGAIVIMGIGLAVALKWPEKPRKDSPGEP